MIDYKKRYDDLMLLAKQRFKPCPDKTERHHVIPVGLGGMDNQYNLVYLYVGEHLLAHWYLTKFLVGFERKWALRVCTSMMMKPRYYKSLDHQSAMEIQDDTLPAVGFLKTLSVKSRGRHDGLSFLGTQFLSVMGNKKRRRERKKEKRLLCVLAG